MPFEVDRQRPIAPQIVAEIRQQVSSGAWGEGTILPSVRRLAAELKVAPMTVVKAYAELSRLGVIESEMGSKTWVAAVRDLAPSVPLVRPFERPRLAETAGVTEYRLAIARLLGQDYLATDADHIMATLGGGHGRALALEALTLPGDRVAVEVPGSRHLLTWLRELRRVPVPIPRHSGQIDLEVAESAFRRGARVLLISPDIHPATGDRLEESNREQLAALLADSDVALIEDRSHARLGFHPGPAPLSSVSAIRAILVDSFSSSVAPGLRLGALWAAPELMARLIRELELRTGPGPAQPQEEFAEWVRSGGFEAHLKVRRSELRQRHLAVRSALSEFMPAGTTWTEADGGGAIWIALPAGNYRRAISLSRELGVPIQSGTEFLDRDGESHLRFLFGDAPAERLPGYVKILAAHLLG